MNFKTFIKEMAYYNVARRGLDGHVQHFIGDQAIEHAETGDAFHSFAVDNGIRGTNGISTKHEWTPMYDDKTNSFVWTHETKPARHSETEDEHAILTAAKNAAIKHAKHYNNYNLSDLLISKVEPVKKVA